MKENLVLSWIWLPLTTTAHHPWTTSPIMHCTHTFPSTITPITQLSPITHLPWLPHHTCTSFTHSHISSTHTHPLRSLVLIQIQIKLGWALFVTYTIIQSIMRSEMCSLHLTHPSVHTWSSGQPTVQRPGSSRGLPVGAGIRTHNLGLPRVSSPTLYPLGQRLPWFCTGWHSERFPCFHLDCLFTLTVCCLPFDPAYL